MVEKKQPWCFILLKDNSWIINQSYTYLILKNKWRRNFKIKCWFRPFWNQNISISTTIMELTNIYGIHAVYFPMYPFTKVHFFCKQCNGVGVERFAVTTGLTDMVYLVRPTGIQTVNTWITKQQPCILPLGYLVIG